MQINKKKTFPRETHNSRTAGDVFITNLYRGSTTIKVIITIWERHSKTQQQFNPVHLHVLGVVVGHGKGCVCVKQRRQIKQTIKKTKLLPSKCADSASPWMFTQMQVRMCLKGACSQARMVTRAQNTNAAREFKFPNHKPRRMTPVVI